MVGGTTSDRLVVGIDFGTTFSGVAAVYSAVPEAPDEITVIRTWPGANNTTSDKVPSEIVYGPPPAGTRSSTNSGRPGFRSTTSSLPDRTTTQSDQPRWGYQIRPEEDRLRCMKLLLDPRQQLPAYVAGVDLRGHLRRTGKDAQTVVADYLTELWKHARAQLERRYGHCFITTTKMDVVLTVPAVWSDAAKDATLRAAERAGMGSSIMMISEPEAAAVYTLKSIQPNHLRPGNNFIVCDAGGGTVDLISYEIEQESPLRVKESAEGTGGCCGAAVLNMRFTDHVRSIMGVETFEDILQRKPRSWQTALKYFDEYVKRNFDPEDTDAEFLIPFPLNDGEASCVDQGYLVISSADVRAIFMPVVEEILELVQGQVSRLEALHKSINGIVLVGGFGQSSYLFECLQNHFKDLAPPPPYPGTRQHHGQPQTQFEVMQPANAWTAVVRGAVLRGLEGADLVLSRRSRRHYGTSFSTTFDDRLHSVDSKHWDDLDEKWKASGMMRWYISKGQACASDTPVTFEFCCKFREGEDKMHTVHLQVCDHDEAPDTTHHHENSTTRRLCALTADLNLVPSRFWINHSNSRGVKYQKLLYVMGMRIESGGLHFDLRVGNVTYGEVVASFD